MEVTPSQIVEYLYCPRFTYFEYVLRIPQYEEKNYKVMRGRYLHDQKLEQNKSYLRKKIGVTAKKLDVYLSSGHLRGIVDEVLETQDGSFAPLDYKFAEYKDKIYDTYKTQLHCYAVLIEANYNKPVYKGFLVYTRSKNKIVEIKIDKKIKIKIIESVKEMDKIISQNFYPKATKSKKRCLSCTYKNICTR